MSQAQSPCSSREIRSQHERPFDFRSSRIFNRVGSPSALQITTKARLSLFISSRPVAATPSPPQRQQIEVYRTIGQGIKPGGVLGGAPSGVLTRWFDPRQGRAA